MFSVVGKRVILTGGARGIGASVSRGLVQHGAKVAILDVLDEQGKDHAENINSHGPGRAFYYHCDISKRSEVFDTIRAAVEGPLVGGLDALHNIAGVEKSTNIEDCTEETFDLLFNVNVKGSLFAAQAAFPYLKAGGGGSIINYSSDAAQYPTPPLGIYGATKGAIVSLTRSMTLDWAPRFNIRTNSVNPLVRTILYESFVEILDLLQGRYSQ
ncbi:short chain dehydrogenase domain-containing protein [Sarocladium implicatum]|nr:short chain dehydrogenase domain-containing protein [Sarocladium implicatum]